MLNNKRIFDISFAVFLALIAGIVIALCLIAGFNRHNFNDENIVVLVIDVSLTVGFLVVSSVVFFIYKKMLLLLIGAIVAYIANFVTYFILLAPYHSDLLSRGDFVTIFLTILLAITIVPLILTSISFYKLKKNN